MDKGVNYLSRQNHRPVTGIAMNEIVQEFLIESNENLTQLDLDFPIHGFLIVANRSNKSVGPKRWRYLGLLEYIRHFPDTQIDTKGMLRKVWVFEMRIHRKPTEVPVSLDARLMAEILCDSRRQSPPNEDERNVSLPDQKLIAEIDPVRVEAVRSRPKPTVKRPSPAVRVPTERSSFCDRICSDSSHKVLSGRRH